MSKRKLSICAAAVGALLIHLSVTQAAADPGEAVHADGDSHAPLTVVGLAFGQTARINVTNSPNPESTEPSEPMVVELMFHDSEGRVIERRSGLPATRTVTIDPHHSASLELNGSGLVAPGSRVTIVPCIKVVSGGGGSLAVPTFEMYNSLLRATTVLVPGVLRGFDPQPDPPVAPEVAFGLVGLTRGVTARLHVLNGEPPDASRADLAAEPTTVEISFHDASANAFVDRSGRPVRTVVTIASGHSAYLDLNGSDVAAIGDRVGIQPCIKVLRSGPGAHVSMALETFVNLTGQTLTLANAGTPLHPVAPAPR